MLGHNPSIKGITIHLQVISQWAINTHGTHSEQASGVTSTPMSTSFPMLSSYFHTGVTRQSVTLRPWLCLPRVLALAMTAISRHTKHEGSFSNNLCLPGRLQDKVPQALHTLHSAGRPFGLSCSLPRCVTGGIRLALAFALLPLFSSWKELG